MYQMFERIVSDPIFNSQYNITIVSQPSVRPPGIDLTDIEHEGYEDIYVDDDDDDEEDDDDDDETNIDEDDKYKRKERRISKQLIRDHGGLWIITVDNFLTEYETKRLIAMGANAGYERSLDAGDILENGDNEDILSEERTSTNAWCITDECVDDQVSKDVYNRMAILTGINVTTNSEPFQLLRYEYGQFYKEHHDLIDEDSDRQQGVRILTIFLYLNTVHNGGETNFPFLNVSVQPVRGRAVLWPSVFNTKPNKPDVRATHQALPVLGHDEVKYGANVWIHQRAISPDC
jgi:2OG-Fe(II) oxygenase superfamily